METLDRTHLEFRSKICDYFLVAVAVMAVPALAGSLLRAVNIGWQPVMGLHIVLAVALWLVALYRGHLAYHVRVGFLLSLFVIVALGGIWTFGLAAGGVAWLVALPVLTTVLVSLRSGLIIFAAVILATSTIGAMIVFEYRMSAFDLAASQKSAYAWVNATFSWILAGGGMAVAIGVLDKFFRKSLETSRKHAEALEESEREYRNILDNMVDTFYRADQDGNLVLASPSAAGLVGYSPEELAGRKLTEFYVDPNGRAEFIERLKVGGGKVNDFEAEIHHRDGRRRWVSTSARFWKDADGNILGVEGVIRDITEHKEAEEALRRSQKMETVGQLTGGVAHDFNNLLAAILGSAEILEGRLGTNDKSTQTIIRAAERGAQLTQRLLAFSRRQPLRPRPIDLVDLVGNVHQLLHRTLGETIDMEIAMAPSLWNAVADPGQLENALLNLAINARDAMPGGGKLTIETANVSLTPSDLISHMEVAPGDYVSLSVRDTGTGMTPEIVEHAFEPFFTTKDVGEGSGLGLSMVHGFAKQSGGDIIIESEPGHGTTVTLLLPRAQESIEGAETGNMKSAPRGHGETILVVEDEPDVRAVTEAMLQNLGYRVLSAENARGGLDILQAGPAIDLVLSDVVLPGGMSGPDLAAQARTIKPEMRVLFMSGYMERLSHHQDPLPEGSNLLDKPFRVIELAERVRAVLDR